MEIIEGTLLRLFISEQDKFEGMPLSEWILRKAKDAGIMGATIFRGIAGFGTHSRIHSVKVISLSEDLPLVIEISDTTEKIETLLPILETGIKEGVATKEKIVMHRYRQNK